MLIEKARQQILLYDTKSPDYRDQHMRANAWEGIGKELKIKRKFYVSSRDVTIVYPRLESYGCLSALHEGAPGSGGITPLIRNLGNRQR